MDEKNLEDKGVGLDASGGLIGNFNRTIDKYSEISAEELLEFLGTLNGEDENE